MTDWLLGMAAHLATVEHLGLAWRPDSPYQPGEVALAVDHAPAEPVECVTLTGYEGAESDGLTDTPRMQARVRSADLRTSRRRCQAIYDHLHHLGPVELPDGTWVQLVIGGGSGAGFRGLDQAGHPEHASNFDVDLHNPARRGRSA